MTDRGAYTAERVDRGITRLDDHPRLNLLFRVELPFSSGGCPFPRHILFVSLVFRLRYHIPYAIFDVCFTSSSPAIRSVDLPFGVFGAVHLEAPLCLKIALSCTASPLSAHLCLLSPCDSASCDVHPRIPAFTETRRSVVEVRRMNSFASRRYK